MLISSENLNSLWCNLVIEELIRNGIDYFCISPGSRSTPLTVAAARHPHAQTMLCYDERGAAFHALGYARSAGRSAVLICTSGTAAANYFPAIIEAAMDRLPMLVFSADRPPELQQTGANQTIQQGNLFGAYSKWHVEIPCPTTAISGRMLLTTVDQAVYQAHTLPGGPVHLNLMFREPLELTPEAIQNSYLEDLTSWLEATAPFTDYRSAVKVPDPESICKISSILAATKYGIVSVGRLSKDSQRKAVLKLLKLLQWPVFADILSGLRLGFADEPIIHYFDQLLLSESFCKQYQLETILHIGGELLSKRFFQFTQVMRPLNYLVIKDHPFRHDALHNVSFRLDADIQSACIALAEHINYEPESRQWLNTFFSSSHLIHKVIADSIILEHTASEISIAYLVSKNIPLNHGLWLANSMPIRDMDMYGSDQSHALWIGANRGASGIDGTLASATGFAMGLQSPVTLIIGDIAFLHDMNSLGLVKKCAFPLIIIIINNNGGGIFSFLPIAQFEDFFEDYFATPHNLCFESIAGMFSIPYFQPKTNNEFVNIYRKSLSSMHTVIIEVLSDRQLNYQLHQTLQHLIVKKIDS
jgi:2-succinyl-5-enolpyruvyl-6-hydroxy-3-cyclohexene-1-carboxylate synthase